MGGREENISPQERNSGSFWYKRKPQADSGYPWWVVSNNESQNKRQIVEQILTILSLDPALCELLKEVCREQLRR
jgi:negative regulator of replication initiation